MQNGKLCRGFDLTDTARKYMADTNSFNLQYIIIAFKNFPNKDEFFSRNNFFSKLAGNDQLQKQISAGMSEADIRATWQPALDEFKKMRKQYLLYPDFE